MKRWQMVALLLGLPLSIAAAEPKLPELKLIYSAAWNGFNLGEVIVTLKSEGAPDCYRYESSSNPSGMVRMFYGKPHETSDFCVSGGKIVPKRFSFVNTKGKERNFTLDFDAAAGKVKDGKGGVRDVPPNAQDRFGIQQAVRLWVLAQGEARAKAEPGAATGDFAMVDDRRIRHYRFAITGHEEIEVPAGKFETVVVQRIDDPKKTSKFWLAPARDYMPIKVEQIKGGDADLRMVLRPNPA